MKILITGCTGYIGSNTCVELLENGYDIVGINRANSRNVGVIDSIKRITGKSFPFYECDLKDISMLYKIFKDNNIDCVIDMASSKGVTPSINNPFSFYDNNINGPLVLLNIMNTFGVLNYIYGSSSAVYGNSSVFPIKEDGVDIPINPYGRSKLFVEKILSDVVASNSGLNARVLRVFNPLGAHESWLLGDRLDGGTGNILTYLCCKVASDEEFVINGNDYATLDGTCVRDYIHVSDVARAYRLTIEEMIKNKSTFDIYNIGSGKGTSVQQLVDAFIMKNGIKPNVLYGLSRVGDVPISYADTSKAFKNLGFSCEKSIDDMVVSAWQREKMVQEINIKRIK